jgi:hypothetical protein
LNFFGNLLTGCRELIEVDKFSDDECDSSICSDDSKLPGDSIGKLQFHYDQNMRSNYDLDNAIDRDAATTVASNTEATDNLSDKHHQTECAIDGKSDYPAYSSTNISYRPLF